MLDDTTASWWYEQDGQQAGPVTAAEVARLVAGGRLGPAHRVWRDGMAGWEPLGRVPELAEALPAARPAIPAPPPLSPAPAAPAGDAVHGASSPRDPFAGRAPTSAGGWGAPSGAAPAPGPAPFEEISPGATIALSFVTFGIYGLVKFHQTGKGLEALAGRTSTFSRDFWLSIGLAVASGATAHTFVLGGPLWIASLVFSVLALSRALELREEVVRRAPVRPVLTDAGTHKALFIAGCLLTPILVGVVLLAVQAWKWFSDWNAVGSALAGPAGPVPSATTPASWR